MNAIFEAARARGIKQIRLMIYQPKVYQNGPREWTCSLEDLEKFATLARSKAASVRVAEESHGKIDQTEWERTFLHPNPNEQDCAFCRAMATCPAAARQVQKVVGEDFGVVVEQEGLFPVDAETKPVDLSVQMKATGFIEDWCKSVRAEVERRLLLDQEVPGFGLELGRQGPRKWKDREEIEELLRKKMRLSTEDVYNLKLKSPTQLEEMTKVPKGSTEKPLIGPRQWTSLKALVVRSDPKPSVKPANAITKPYKPTKPDASDFTAVNDGCDLV